MSDFSSAFLLPRSTSFCWESFTNKIMALRLRAINFECADGGDHTTVPLIKLIPIKIPNTPTTSDKIMSSVANRKSQNSGDLFSRLSTEDRADIKQLASLIKKHANEGGEEFDAAVRALAEILNQYVPQLVEYSLSPSPKSIQKWRDFIAMRIADERKARGLSQSELAKLCDLPQSHISRIETAKLSPNHLTLTKIAIALGIPLAKLDSHAPDDE